MAGHRQVISRISKGSQNIFIYNFILPLLTARAAARAEAFLPENLPWRRHCMVAYALVLELKEVKEGIVVIARLLSGRAAEEIS